MKKILTILVLFLVTLSVRAQETEIDNALLWKVEGNGIATSYIYGTMHVLCDATLPEKVEEALANTQVVVLELDMDSPTLQAEVMKGMMLPNDESISKYLTDDEAALLNTYLKTHIDMGLAQVDKMIPLMLESLLIPALLDCPVQSIEANLMAHASKENKEILGLEEVDAQLSAFNKIPLEEQVRNFLKKAIDGIEKDKALFVQMQKVYQQQNVTELMHIMQEDFADLMNHSDAILHTRNKSWIPRIAEISSRQPAFYGVGAAHLAGASGVVNLLEEQGYEVTPVFND